MKNKIINESILMLRDKGLKFSIDDLAKKLKISKKTIYKYFATKEMLAIEIYKHYYKILCDEINDMPLKDKDFATLINIYFDSFKMVQDSVFNKYNLNETIRSNAMSKHFLVWKSIKEHLIKMEIAEEVIKNMQVIIDGTFYQLASINEELNDNIKEMLVRIIWK